MRVQSSLNCAHGSLAGWLAAIVGALVGAAGESAVDTTWTGWPDPGSTSGGNGVEVGEGEG
ncbi:MAG TPA: hypothetical protein VJ302_10905 [Blastocatellia bacterium]|nr:hypothetical protein [Blastocatellia bacterium]